MKNAENTSPGAGTSSKKSAQAQRDIIFRGPAALILQAGLSAGCCVFSAILFERYGVPCTSVLYVALLAAFLYAFRQRIRGIRMEIFCYIAALCYLTGMRLQAGYILTFRSCLAILIAAIGYGRLASVCCHRLIGFLRELRGDIRKFLLRTRIAHAVRAGYRRYLSMSCAKRLLITAAVLFVCWFPVFLAYYPGITAYDTAGQLKQIAGRYSTHHPLLHSLLLNGLYSAGVMLGHVNWGIAAYTLLQMGILAAALSFLLLFLQKWKVHGAVCCAMLIFLSFMPLVSMLAVSVTKDVIFAAVMLVSFICLCDFCLDPAARKDRREQFLFIVSSVLTCLFRNQGIYVIAAVLVTLLIVTAGKDRRAVLRSGCLVILSYIVINQGLITATGAVSGSTNEMLSIPYQQIARTYIYEQENLSDETIEEIKTILPEADDYDPAISDKVKGSGEGMNNTEIFLELYLELGRRYPFRYLEAVLYTDFGYWYIDDVSFAAVKSGYLETAPAVEYVIPESLFPKLYDLYEDLFGADCGYRNVPVLSILFHPALYMWIFLGILIAYARRRTVRTTAPPVIMLLTFIATLLAGPCVLPRYIFPFMVLLPAFCVCMRESGKDGIR